MIQIELVNNAISAPLPALAKINEPFSDDTKGCEPIRQMPNDLERTATTTAYNDPSKFASPQDEPPSNAVSIQPSFWYPKMNKFRVMAACLTYFGNGVNDSAPGALIPYLEDWYGIGYAVVSLIFVANAAGFVISAFITAAITAKLGRARALMVSEAFMIAGYAAAACSPPFPVVVLAYLLLGLGAGLNLALNNVFCANLAGSTVIMGAASGMYDLGGVIGPIVATAMISAGIHWARFFVIAVALRVACFVLSGWAYWAYESEASSYPTRGESLAGTNASGAREHEPTRWQLLKRAMRNKTTIVGALVIFAYQGAEVSESGWFISYLVDSKGADPKQVGYVTSGFWAGITVGRLLLTYATRFIGEKNLVLLLGAGTIAFQLLAWLLPGIIGNSVAVAFVGLFLGPVYPCATTMFSRLLPVNLQVSAMGFISSAGSSGGAVVPFLTGLLAQKAGAWVLHPICIAFFVMMLAVWLLLPAVEKRAD